MEQGLRELIGAGLVTSDGFQGLRTIAQGWRSHRRRRLRRSGFNSTATSPPGRWAAINVPDRDPDDEYRLAESLAGMLLDRYGVIFRDLMQQESVAMPWRYLLKALRRLEARGEVRGGRFVSGFVGEQYALPEAVKILRDIRREPPAERRVSVSAADVLNLTAITIPGPRVASHSGRAVVLTDGVPNPEATELTAAI